MTSVLRPRDVFGPDLDAALVANDQDPDAARCQVAVAKMLVKIATTKLKAFNACKKSGLQSGDIRGPADLAGCHAAMTGPAVPKVVGKCQGTAAKAGAGAALAH